jgi:hypothetical protein
MKIIAVVCFSLLFNMVNGQLKNPQIKTMKEVYGGIIKHDYYSRSGDIKTTYYLLANKDTIGWLKSNLDSNGRALYITDYMGTKRNNPTSEAKLEYNKWGHLIKSIELGPPVDTVEYVLRHDSLGKLIYDNGISIERTFDKNNNIVSEKRFVENGKTKKKYISEVKMEYDKNGRLIKQTTLYKDRIQNCDLMEYDKQGNMTKYTLLDKKMKKESIVTYTYNQYGDWIESKYSSYVKGKFVSEGINTREYEYYK